MNAPSKRSVVLTNQFRKDFRLMVKRGKNLSKLQSIINLLTTDTPLTLKHKDHPLIGNYKDHRECHIEPDWLLIWRASKSGL